MNSSVRGASVLALALVASLVAKVAPAANQSWVASSMGDWSVGSYWSGNLTPTGSDAAYIGNGGTATITQPGMTCSGLTLGGAGSGTIAMNGGFLSVGNATTSTYLESLGNAQPGNFIQSGGTHSIYLGLALGDGTASGSYVLTGGSLAAPNINIGNNGSGSFTQSGGTCWISNQLDEGVSLDGGNGVYVLSGSGLLVARQEVIGDVTSGTFTQSGGTNSVSGGIVLGQGIGASGTYNLNGGLLSISSSRGLTAGTGGNAVFNMNGGTLHSGTSVAASVPISIGSGSNASFDTGSGTMTISAGINGSGKLTKTGTGALILSGTNTYSGGTVVTAGTLRVVNRNSLPSGSNLTIGTSASAYFGSPIVPDESLDGLVAVPEPSTLALFGFGAIGLVGWLLSSRRLKAAI
jgi:autotransporter-associated beta strand protein